MHILGETRRLARELCFTEGPEDILVTKDLRKLWMREILAPLIAEEASLINIQGMLCLQRKRGQRTAPARLKLESGNYHNRAYIIGILMMGMGSGGLKMTTTITTTKLLNI